MSIRLVKNWDISREYRLDLLEGDNIQVIINGTEQVNYTVPPDRVARFAINFNQEVR